MLQTIPISPDRSTARADLPEALAGLSEAQRTAVTHARRAFCHNGRFIASAKSYESIRTMATAALQAIEQRRGA